MTDLNLRLAANPVAYVLQQEDPMLKLTEDQHGGDTTAVEQFLAQTRAQKERAERFDQQFADDTLAEQVVEALVEVDGNLVGSRLVERLVEREEARRPTQFPYATLVRQFDYDSLGRVLHRLADEGRVAISEDPSFVIMNADGSTTAPLSIKLRSVKVGNRTYVLDEAS